MPRPFPPSDHSDGRRFFNPGQAAGRRFLQVLRWRLAGGRVPWQPAPPDPRFAPPPEIVGPGTVAITFINHASFLIGLPGMRILTDPMFSLRCSPVSWAGPKRARPPGLAIDELPRPDLILLSHSHYDHMDLPSLRALQRRFAAPVATLLGNGKLLGRLGIATTELDWWESATIAGLRVTATPARHFSARTPFNVNRTLWGGFMLRTESGRVFFAGDSASGPHWAEIRARLGAPDVALLPIGAYDPRWLMSAMHMDPEKAVTAHQTLGAAHSVGMHFGTFQLTDEAIDAPPAAMRAARDSAGLDAAAFVTQGFGETRIYTLGGAAEPEPGTR